VEKKSSAKAKPSFEKALEELEKIAERLEDGSLGLEESIAEFERGTRLARYCREKLDEAERRIEILQKGENGSVEKRAVRVKQDTGEIDDDEDMQGSLL
jgi:exodeoxyribonuclease VII small subunit